MAPIVRACQRRKEDFFILHTGQHFTKELDEQIFDDLNLPKPKYNLGIGGQPYRMQVGIMIKEIGNILIKEKPDMVLVQGDTISVLAGALAANKLNIKVGHHEAGLRSHDIKMLEEINRVIVDHVSDYLFAPTPDALKNLHQEGREADKIHFTGNTIVDAVKENIGIADKKSKILEKLKLKKGEYFLATTHRAENVDNAENLKNIIDGLSQVEEKFKLPIILPLHPRTKRRLKEFNLSVSKKIKIIPPLGFLDFLQLEGNAKLVLTDSGGIQEECFILQVPCVTLRENTERPETVEHGGNIIAGTNPEKILKSVQKILKKNPKHKEWQSPFGDGKAGERIIDIIDQHIRLDTPKKSN